LEEIMSKRLAGLGVGLVLVASWSLTGCGGGDDGGSGATAGSSNEGGASGGGNGGTAGKGGTGGTNASGGGGAAGKGGSEGAAGKGGSNASGGSGGSSGANASGGSSGGGNSNGNGGQGGGGGEPCTPASTDGVDYSGTCTYADHCTDEYDVTFTIDQLKQLCEAQAGTWSTTKCDPAAWDIRCTQAVFGGVYLQYLPEDGICAGCKEVL
jgi:hypothetical protein